ncbi:unnamed protein product [Triticum aestivum]|uniref:DUF6598 domain-containing protein n=3 Tax=Triticinae TaxID=1648030 RepID=A0A9R1JI49_WHEAT|nr:uncharacterized protein LOC109769560 [Aegilops tauschii subsp. strangulata]XP_044333841.1 uncharacterized protein LOC123054193 [Triticum aestivum]XP_044333842.1 uncharacterized protein LOC123054193 [Triticum aestivum]XP_044333843.1 uncharacterized protein LOC123054193 [Triticum aestivum]XP_044333844.1 uncharacterized protein LOC123054193 [Triticum aestivum]KAF7017812.1 hypothetical protein CFC21_031181 [Triticum aestivum]SPT19461.1 unnamed protein product [Triticum aestivum]
MELSDSELAGVKSYREYIELMEKKEEEKKEQLRKDCEIKHKRTYGEQEIEEHREGSRSFCSLPSPSRVEADSQYGLPRKSLQIFSIKVTDLKYGLSWPLQVYGSVAFRNSVEPKVNYLFRCTRDNCQTLTQKDPFLRLTGPSRAIWLLDTVFIDVQLKVKCKKESEDEVLTYNFSDFHELFPFDPSKHVTRRPIPCKRCTLELDLAMLPSSVEATVGVRVVDGSWPDQLPGLVACSTDGVKGGKVALLDFQDGKLPAKSDGVVELVRRVVSVDYPGGKLIVSVEASRDGFSAQCTVEFEMQVSGRSTDMCDLIFCKMEVTVCWSTLLVQNILE